MIVEAETPCLKAEGMLIKQVFEKYEIADLRGGKLFDRLGHLYEEYVQLILNDKDGLDALKQGCIISQEDKILYKILVKVGLNDFNMIDHISATTDVPRRSTNGNSKTDVIATIHLTNGNKVVLPISCKASTARRVSVAEFSVDTISKEVGISDPVCLRLLRKFQNDGSAKNFSRIERDELTARLSPTKRKFVRWALTGDSSGLGGESTPLLLIHFKLDKATLCPSSVEVSSVEEEIEKIVSRRGGFGTGLSWTYATGSKGLRIQFKA